MQSSEKINPQNDTHDNSQLIHGYPSQHRWFITNKPLYIVKEKQRPWAMEPGLEAKAKRPPRENGPPAARRSGGRAGSFKCGSYQSPSRVPKIASEAGRTEWEVSKGERMANHTLVNDHISPQRKILVKYCRHANLISIEKKKEIEFETVKKENKEELKEKRGKIIEFTRRSRRRLMNLMAMVIKIVLPIFVTLTFPDNHPGIKGGSRYRENFMKRLKRKYPGVGYIWRMEIKRRKSGDNKGTYAAHYHLFLWNVPFEEAIRTLPSMWSSVCGVKDTYHDMYGCEVERIESTRKVMGYAAKYMSKIEDNDILKEGIGRVWGYGGKVPLDPGEQVEITQEESYIIMRYLRRCTNMKHKGIRKFYVNNPEHWYQNHLKLIRCDVPF